MTILQESKEPRTMKGRAELPKLSRKKMLERKTRKRKAEKSTNSELPFTFLPPEMDSEILKKTVPPPSLEQRRTYTRASIDPMLCYMGNIAIPYQTIPYRTVPYHSMLISDLILC